MIFSLTSCRRNPAASPFASPVRATGTVTGCHSWPNVTATTKCCFSWAYRPRRAAYWTTASVAPVTPWPHTGTGGSPRYTALDPTQTPTLSPRRALTMIPFPFLLHRAAQVSVGTKSESRQLWISQVLSFKNMCFSPKHCASLRLITPQISALVSLLKNSSCCFPAAIKRTILLPLARFIPFLYLGSKEKQVEISPLRSALSFVNSWSSGSTPSTALNVGRRGWRSYLWTMLRLHLWEVRALCIPLIPISA